MAEKIILKGHKGIGGTAEGEALVCKEPINLMADSGNCWNDPTDATFTNILGTPSVFGKSFKDKVLVFPTGKGGIFSSNILMDMKAAGTMPKAIINTMAHRSGWHCALNWITRSLTALTGIRSR
jgi:predicted aconitase with swiveling domain